MSLLLCSQCDAFLDKDDLDSSNWNGDEVTCDCCLSKGESA